MLIQSCVRPYDPDCPKFSTIYTYLTASAINQTPYFTNPAFDTISYASDKGDTVTFVKTKTDTSWYCENEYPSGPDCGAQKHCYQILHNTYATIKGIGSFDVKLINNNSVITIIFMDNIFSLYNDKIGVKTPKGYIDNITFNNKIYNKVTFLEGIGNVNDCNAYINVTYGLFRFEFLTDKVNWIFYEK
jgi:hypothetical protein